MLVFACLFVCCAHALFVSLCTCVCFLTGDEPLLDSQLRSERLRPQVLRVETARQQTLAGTTTPSPSTKHIVTTRNTYTCKFNDNVRLFFSYIVLTWQACTVEIMEKLLVVT